MRPRTRARRGLADSAEVASRFLIRGRGGGGGQRAADNNSRRVDGRAPGRRCVPLSRHSFTVVFKPARGSLMPQLNIRIRAGSDDTKTQQIFNQIASAILAGKVEPGESISSERA